MNVIRLLLLVITCFSCGFHFGMWSFIRRNRDFYINIVMIMIGSLSIFIRLVYEVM